MKLTIFVKHNIRKSGCTFQIIVRPYLGLQMLILVCNIFASHHKNVVFKLTPKKIKFFSGSPSNTDKKQKGALLQSVHSNLTILSNA